MMGAYERLDKTTFAVDGVFAVVYSQIYADCAKAKTREERERCVKLVTTVAKFHMKFAEFEERAVKIAKECDEKNGEEMALLELPYPFDELEGKTEAQILAWLTEKMQASLAAVCLERAREKHKEKEERGTDDGTGKE